MTAAICPSCGEASAADASFCEACGAELALGAGEAAGVGALGDGEAAGVGAVGAGEAAGVGALGAGEAAGVGAGEAADVGATPGSSSNCVSCGAGPDQLTDGYCMQCGYRQPGPRDHVELDLGILAGVTDRGQRHRSNEDAMAMAVVDDHMIIVVCDGVSTTANAAEASQGACDAAVAVLEVAVGHRTPFAQAIADAAFAAQEAVAKLAVGADPRRNPSCTFVAAIVAPAGVGPVSATIGWLGDSRAYWIGAAETLLLSTDHSWATEMVVAGVMSEDEAMRHPQAHTITRWIGADAPEGAPDSVAVDLIGPGQLLLCSDGLWNYAPDTASLGALGGLAAATSIDRARRLVDYANEAGGHDNITVVLAEITA